MKATTGNDTLLSKHDKKIVQKYVRLLDAVPGPISVWATTDEGLLHFYTLISPDREIETKLYEVERQLILAIDPELVDFDVHTRPEIIHEYLFKNTPPLYKRP